MKFYRRDKKLYVGKDFEDAMLFAEYMDTLDGNIPVKYSKLFKEGEIPETTLEDEIENYLRYEMGEGNIIELWNEYVDNNCYGGRIDYYGNARDYVSMLCADSEEELDMLDRLYSSDVPYYGEYIVADCGHGIHVGDYSDVWDDSNYTDLAQWISHGYSHCHEVEDIIDEFSDAEESYDDAEDTYQEWLEEQKGMTE